MPNATSETLSDETRKAMAPEPFRILKTRTVAERLGCSPQALRVKRMKGDGPPWVRLSRNRVGYEERSLEEWIRSRTFRSIAEERHGHPAA